MAWVKQYKDKLELTTDIDKALEKGVNERNALALTFVAEGMSSDAVFNRLKIIDKDLNELFRLLKEYQIMRFDSVVDAEEGLNLTICHVYVLLRIRVHLKNVNAHKIVVKFKEAFPACIFSAATPIKKILFDDKGLAVRDANRYATVDEARLRLANAIVVFQMENFEKFAQEKKNREKKSRQSQRRPRSRSSPKLGSALRRWWASGKRQCRYPSVAAGTMPTKLKSQGIWVRGGHLRREKLGFQGTETRL